LPLDFDIVRASHVELMVTDLERSRDFYVKLLGFVETGSDRSHIYLRGIEDRFHHCLVLTKAEMPAVGHISYRVRKETDLERIEALFSSFGLPVKWLKSGEGEEGRGSAIRLQDPLGFPVEFFFEMEEAEWMLRRFHEQRGAKIMRIDHFNVLVPDVTKASEWYTDKLGFACSEYTETEGPEKDIWATWLRRKPTVHDIAIMTGTGPRLHHAGFVVAEKDNILDCADIMASKGFASNMERGPGRHGISNAFFLYIRDPDGHRIELYTGDYLAADPNWRPLKWLLRDPQRQTFWGAPAPERWFDEASVVLSVFDGKPVPTKARERDARRL
jgi:catechol 2,3-dioxygenase